MLQSAALKEFKEGVLLAEQCISFALNFYLDVPSSLNVMRDVSIELKLQPPVDAAAATAMSLSPHEAQARMKLYKGMGQFIQERCLLGGAGQGFPRFSPLVCVFAFVERR